MRKLPLLLGLAALLAVPAVGQALRGHNVKSPVDVEADRIEVQDRADRAVFSGNVVVRQLEPTIHYEFAFMFPADRPRTTLASMFIQAAEEGLRQQNQDHHH